MKFIIPFYILFLFILVSSCKNRSAAEPELRMHLQQFELTLDPHSMEDMYSMFVVIQIYRGLLRYLPDAAIRPDIAESWTESEDRRIYTFKLKHLTFSDGSRITAENVVWSFARMYRTKAAMASDMGYLSGTDAYVQSGRIEELGVRAISADTVEFKLKYPSALFLKHLATADCAILPVSFSHPDFDKSSTVASGPFRIEHHNKDEIILSKWRSDTYDSKNPPQKIHLTPASYQAFDAAIKGETDSLANDRMSATQTLRLLANNWKKVVGGLARERFVIMNPKLIPLTTRKWLYHQIQTEKLLSDLNLDLFPAYGLIPATLPGNLNLKDVTDLRKEPSPNPKAMNITLDYMEGDVTDQQIASYLKNSWEKWGIKVILHGYNTTDYLERLFKAESAAILGKKGMDYPDGFSTLGYFQKSYPGSYFHVADNEIDMLIQRAAGEFDDSIRIAFYREIQKKILRHYTIIPITFGSPESGLWSNRVEFTPSHPMGFHTIPLEMIEMSKVNF